MITTVTLNTAIDKAYFLDDAMESGTVMRVVRCRDSAGGKGLNVARIVKLCGSDVKATGFIGGYSGQYLTKLLEKDGIKNEFIRVSGETRCCINILDSKHVSTEFLEPGCIVSEEEVQDFLENFPQIINDSQIVTISGSVPRGITSQIYAEMILIAKKRGKQVILDTSGEALAKGIEAAPTMMKPNKKELEALCGCEILSIEDCIECAKKLYQKGIKYIVISLGEAGSLLYCDDGIYRATVPEVEIANTVGSGDSMVGGFAVGMERQYSAKEMLRFASAVATANAMSPNTGDFDQNWLENIITHTQVQKIQEAGICH